MRRQRGTDSYSVPTTGARISYILDMIYFRNYPVCEIGYCSYLKMEE